MPSSRSLLLALVAFALPCLASPAFAADAPRIDTGNTAWMLRFS
jgi:hypothetical protein